MASRDFNYYPRQHVPSTVQDASLDAVFQLQQSSYPPPPESSLPSASSFDVNNQAEAGVQTHTDPGAASPHASSGSNGGASASARPVIPPGVDTSLADLTYRHPRRAYSANNPSPEGWLYPHKKGIGTGSNLEDFKSEIEERTQRGENCKAIADALTAKGVQTSDKAISRVRIKWGMRKRAQRKVKTPPPDSEAARLSAKAKVQALRKIEITRMTKEGMTAEQIYENLTSRGMELRKGVATVLRLQSAWKLIHNEKRFVDNFRHQCHKQAKAQQIKAFRDIAKELTIDDVDAWLEARMSEEASREARHQLALSLMGKHAPTNPERRKLQPLRRDPAAQKPDAHGGDVSESDSESALEADENVATDPWAETDSAFAPLHDEPDTEMDDDGDDGPDSAASVAARVFARVGQSLSEPTDASPPAPVYPDPLAHAAAKAAAREAATATSQPNPNPSPSVPAKRGRGRPRKSINKPGSAPDFEPPSTPTAVGTAANRAPDEATESGDQTTSPAAQGQANSAAVPQPMLVLRPEEAEANRTALSTLDQYNAAAETYRRMLQARTENKPLPGSLTGLPPSANEVEMAKRRLKEATQAMMLNLE